MRKDAWTIAEYQYIIDNHETMTDKEMMAGLPGRTESAIGGRVGNQDGKKYFPPCATWALSSRRCDKPAFYLDI